jgi:hypothetical protein
VQVVVNRNAMPMPLVLLLSTIGGGMVWWGYFGPGHEDLSLGEDISTTLLDWLGYGILAIGAFCVLCSVLGAIRGALRRALRRRSGGSPPSLAPLDDDAELPEPPGFGVGVMGVVIGEGTPPTRCIAASLLECARHGAITIEEHGDRVVLRGRAFPPTLGFGERLVLQALSERMGGTGFLEGPPVWRGRFPAWRPYRTHALGEAQRLGLLTTRIPMIGVVLGFIFGATGFSMIEFDKPLVFVGSILFCVSFPHLLTRLAGYCLSPSGEAARSRLVAYANHVRGHGSLHDVGPEGVAVWGHHLVAGTVLGLAPLVTRALAPEGEEHEDPIVTSQPL